MDAIQHDRTFRCLAGADGFRLKFKMAKALMLLQYALPSSSVTRQKSHDDVDTKTLAPSTPIGESFSVEASALHTDQCRPYFANSVIFCQATLDLGCIHLSWKGGSRRCDEINIADHA